MNHESLDTRYFFSRVVEHWLTNYKIDGFRFDLSNTNWGFNIGAGLNFNKSAEISLLYQRGFTNILPGKDAAPEVNKLGLIQLDLKLYFPKQYYNPHQKR